MLYSLFDLGCIQRAHCSLEEGQYIEIFVDTIENLDIREVEHYEEEPNGAD